MYSPTVFEIDPSLIGGVGIDNTPGDDFIERNPSLPAEQAAEIALQATEKTLRFFRSSLPPNVDCADWTPKNPISFRHAA